MPSPRAPGASRRARERRAVRRLRRAAVLTVIGSVLVVTLALTAFGPAAPERVSATSVAAPPSHLLPDAQPHTQIVAVQGPLKLQLPIAQAHVTAIGYHAGANALALDPLGRQGNRGFLRRLLDRVVGSDGGGLVYYRLEGGGSAGTSVLDVGAAPGTDVFAPVDGTVIGITDFVLDDQPRGVRIDVQPSSAPSLVVSLTRLRSDPALTVGMSVAAGVTKLGAVLDLSGLERQALARFTRDGGNHVSVEVRPAATLSLLP